ncbi:hypothetical protein [Streptosporangium sp. OZ121]|uniref:hypothetical protein n=1 Tax=Streptosporangium sp. OZ121 TaxID=3444183 RepID=UPI003F7AC919
MTETPEVSEDTAGRDTPGQDPPPAGPRGADGETRVVAERSGSDTTFPERPLLADPDDARRTPEEESPEGASQAEAAADDKADDKAGDGAESEVGAEEGDGGDGGDGGAEDSEGDRKGAPGNGTPEPEVGPAS